MAREESNREDLLREATALIERIELVATAFPFRSPDSVLNGPIVAGFRSDGALSVFFSEDIAYQFNAAGELRRAYHGGLMFKAAKNKLVSLSRVRSDHQVQLVRHELTEFEHATFMNTLTEFMREFANLLSSQDFEVRGQVPADADVLGRLRTWLSDHQKWPIAERPNA